MLLDKVNHVLGCHCLHRDCFNPLGKIVHRHHYELMTFAGWRINLADQIDPQPLNGHGLIIGFITDTGDL
jgi:hypothetical protein